MPLFKNNESYDIQKVLDHLNEFWHLSITDTDNIDDETAVFDIDGQMIAIAKMSVPVPMEDLQSVAPYNFMVWDTAIEDLKDHTGHAIITVMSSNKLLLYRYSILTKLLHSVLSTSNSIRVYQGEQTLLLPRDYYISYAENLLNNQYPIPLWIYVGIRKEDDNSMSLYTYGLDKFGKNEMEIIKSKMDVEDLYNFILNITSYIIGSNVILNDGETIGYSATHKVPIELSKAVYLKGQSLKLVI